MWRVVAGLTLLMLPLGGHAAGGVWVARMPDREVHPCLMFGPEDLPAIRERINRPPYSRWWQAVQGNGDPVSQAFTWLLTGDPARAEAVRAQLLRCNPTGYHCCCGVADALQGVAEAYDLIAGYPGITATDHRIIRAKLADACERLYLSALESGNGQHPGNQRTRGICALGTAAIVLRGYRDAAHTPQEWLQRALDGIAQEENLSFWREDGMFIEGPGYSSFTLAIMVPFARYYARASGNWLFSDPRLRNALLYLVYATQPDGLCNAFGTTNMGDVVSSLRLCLGARRDVLAALPSPGAAGLRPDDEPLYRWALAEWGSLEAGGVRDIGLFDDRVRPSTAGFPTARFLSTSQEASLRSEWSRKAVALWFKGKDPWLARSYGVYSHCDVGSFILHAHGELLAVDAGYDHWVSMSLYPPQLHNTLLVDGRGPAGDTPGQLESTLATAFLQAGDIVAGYQGIDHRRTFLLVDGRYAVIADDIRSPGPHEYQWQIHTPVSRGTGEVKLLGTRASWTGFDPRSDRPGKVGMEVTWAGPVALARMDKSRWQPFGADPKTDSYDNWAVVATQRAASARYLTVLMPAPRGQEPPTVETRTVRGGRAIVVTQGPVRDTFIATDGATVAVGALRTNARTCALRERGGNPEWVYVSGAGTVEYGGRAVSLEGAERNGEARALVLAAGENRPAPGPHGAWPEPAAVLVDGRSMPAEEIIDLGRVAHAPQVVEVQFRGSVPADSFAAGRATVDGLAVPAEVSAGGRVRVRLGATTEQADHELVVSAAERSAPANWAQVLVRFTMRPLLVNGDFEEGGRAPLGWSLGMWSGEGKYEIAGVSDAPHSGKWCLMMRGVSAQGGLNLVASQVVPVAVGKSYVLSGYYRGEVAASASLCTQSGRGQYIWSPSLGPSAQWIPFRWEFRVTDPDADILGLRVGSVGRVWFDDLRLQER